MAELMPSAPVHRHAQDTGTSCGRACAQMVIASLTGGVIVTQETLQQREHPHDQDLAGGWATHPDEMRDLLGLAPELSAPGWRVANHPTLDAVMAEIVKALTDGMPAVLNLRTADHWVVVSGAILSTGGELELLRMLDPFFPPITGGVHAHQDGCSAAADGLADPWELASGEFGGYDLVVGTTPSPPGMTDYSGQFVAIVPGPAPAPSALGSLIDRIKRRPRPDRPQRHTPGPHLALPLDVLRSELRRFAELAAIPELKRLLEADVRPVVRPVHSIEAPDEAYTLASLFSEDRGFGVTAAFGHGSGSLLHLRVTNSPLLTGSAPPVLWWTRRHLPTLPSPYYPFAQEADHGVDHGEFVRLCDGFTVPHRELG